MKPRRLRAGVFAVLIFVVQQHVCAQIRLPNIIGDNMVLQQQSTVKLWGWGDPSERVIILPSWSKVGDTVVVDGNGKWVSKIQTPAAGGPYTITFQARNTIQLHNVITGEVWVCSGQSNMEMNYNWGLPQMQNDIPGAFNQQIRFFRVPRTSSATPQDDLPGKWEVCDSNTIKNFSAVGYYFGKRVQERTGLPVGLIQSAWSGSPAEDWVPAEQVAGDPVLNSAAKELKPSNGWPTTPGYTYNAMIYPLANTRIAGALWYQGESNTMTAASYAQLLQMLIATWRKSWNQTFPFYVVQIAPFAYGNANVGALLREAQIKTLSVPQTGLVVTTDIAEDTADIHPRNKREVGNRLAGLALDDIYIRSGDSARSPLYREMAIVKNSIVINFDHATAGLMVHGKTATGIFIAGADHVFYPAQVKVSGSTIVISSKNVKQPVAVRYAFSNTAQGNLFSKSGLPVSPFRTDDWIVDTGLPSTK